MAHIRLRCVECGASHRADVRALYCNTCKLPLEVEYTGVGALSRSGLGGLWRLGAPAPVHSPSHVVSMGEGMTAVALLERSGLLLGLASLFGKLEFQSPTGSFKDRGTTVLMSALKEAGVDEIVEDSSGNAGASIAAYAARAGITAHIFAPASAPAPKVQQLRVYGAHVHLIEGSREAATQAAKAFVEQRGLVYASHNLSPFFLEGTKTFAYELVDQFPEGLPDHVVLPVGNGSLLIGAWIGFRELQASGRVKRLPKLHAVQAEVVQPIAAAYMGRPWRPQAGARTAAGGIAVAQPPRLRQALRAVRETGGACVAASEEAILRWQRLLAREEGVYAEPTSAAAFAGLELLARQGVIGARDVVLVPVTGMGLKDMAPAE
ncbi:MAG: threonine synthase [Chloroflexi bacterium]|nr:threonine synthase [Chloroflexota bacterium]